MSRKRGTSNQAVRSKTGAASNGATEKMVLFAALEQAFERHRDKTVIPKYPYSRRTKTIHLPPDVVQELRQLVWTGNKIEAVKRVAYLTGAGLRLSKDYVDQLLLSSITE